MRARGSGRVALPQPSSSLDGSAASQAWNVCHSCCQAFARCAPALCGHAAPRCARTPAPTARAAAAPQPWPPLAARGVGAAGAESQQQLSGTMVAAARGMAGHGAPPAVVPNPLQKIVPPVSVQPRRRWRLQGPWPALAAPGVGTCGLFAPGRRRRDRGGRRWQEPRSAAGRPFASGGPTGAHAARPRVPARTHAP